MDTIDSAAAAATTGAYLARRRCEQGAQKLARDGRALVRGELSGQTLIEYVLIIALLSIVSIAVIVLCGDQIRTAFNKISSVLKNATSGSNTNAGNFNANAGV